MEGLEQQVALRAQKGDRFAFAELVELYKDRLFNLTFRFLHNRSDAEDALQETFLRVYTNLSTYRTEYKFSTWIYRIATNTCIDRMRKKKADFSLDAELDDAEGGTLYAMIQDQGPLPEETLLHDETSRELQEAIEKLPPAYKAVILFKYIHDLSLQEIADILEVPVSTVKTRIHRGREALRAELLDGR